MRHSGHRCQIDDVAGRVADGFAKHGLGPLIDHRADRLGRVVGREPDLDAQGREDVGEIGVGSPIQLRNRYEVVSGLSRFSTDMLTAAEPVLTASPAAPPSSAVRRRSSTLTVGLLIRL